ncbi:MAG: hypothetical protein JRF35_08520 [Deltaproteobacteria bacterium]|nr:hypothetical protein [Deltaproteobacteria bacterium]MBW2311102.1 hypothetical protein [Deltaproteobacteria bacterium]
MKQNKGTYAERNAVLYYLDEGIISHFAGRYKESNKSFFEAEAIMDKLYTKSISKEAASFVISDNTVPYRGEDFEMAMVNLFLALNYAGLGKWEDAVVEARKVDSKLNLINSKYEEGKKNVYKEDAFIRFLMGSFYEVEGEINDAFISYQKSEEIYRRDYLPNYGISPPPILIENLLTSADAMGFYEEAAQIEKRYPSVTFMEAKTKRRMAEVLVIHYNGMGPEKREEYFLIPMPDGYVMKIAYPKFVRRDYGISHGKVMVRNLETGRSYSASTLLMEDIAAIAVINLENRINRVKAKAIARATTKYLASSAASKAVEQRHGALAGMLTKMTANIASVATEQADVRQWRLLPAEIRVGRVIVPPGEYSGSIRFVGRGGAVIYSKELSPFSIKEREKKIFTYRTLR